MSKRGNPRKSRRLRIDIASRWGKDQEFRPDSADWQRIEDAYGQKLPTDDRKILILFVDQYFRFQPVASHAPFVDDAIQYIDRLEKAGKHFWEVMLEHERIPMSGDGSSPYIAEHDRLRGVAVRYVQSHFSRYLKELDFKRHTDWNGLLDAMVACQVACMKAREYITDQAARNGFVEGRPWNSLIWRLSEFAKERNWSYKVTKFDDPGRASPFVCFVRELQFTFPEQFRRHWRSNAALAEAITVVRREIRRELQHQAIQKINVPGQPN